MEVTPKELRGIPLFAGLDETQLERVRAIARVVEVKRRDVIFREGDPVEGIFILLRGRVKLYRLGADGREHILHVVRPGQTFAEAAVFMPGGYPAFAEALEKSRALLLPKAAFMGLLRDDPAISLAMIAALSRYLRQFVDRIEDLSLKDVPARLARWFLSTSREKGRDFWDLDITKAELASQLGTAGETLSRTLRKFREAGWIEVRGRFVKILDRGALEAVAEGGETGLR